MSDILTRLVKIDGMKSSGQIAVQEPDEGVDLAGGGGGRQDNNNNRDSGRGRNRGGGREKKGCAC